MHSMGSPGANSLISIIILLLSISTALTISLPQGISKDDENGCVYTLYVRTGSKLAGGTDSVIGVELHGADGDGLQISDLPSWGRLRGDNSENFEKGKLDVFSGRGPCLKSPPCSMNLTSDGSGLNSGWYCSYVELTTTGPHIPCQQQLFTVEQWLDTFPYQLYAVRDKCGAPQPAAVGELVRRGAEDVM